jgi:hypothetical protein
MINKTIAREFIAPRRQGAKLRIFSEFSELGVLCVFAGVISFPILERKNQPRISNTFG